MGDAPTGNRAQQRCAPTLPRLAPSPRAARLNLTPALAAAMIRAQCTRRS